MGVVMVSVVAPVFNEAAILAELAGRCASAVRAVDDGSEVILVDDASTDTTRAVDLSAWPPVRLLSLPKNRRQFGATQAGLRAATGEIVVVLDGDLQDPPEIIPDLVRALRAHPEAEVVFAVKATRDDPLWFRAGRRLYGLLAALPGSRALPAGAGAFCAMRREQAARVAVLALPDANLAAVLIGMGVRFRTHTYAKGPRYDGRSRVGPIGLIREALPSLALTGALTAATRWSTLTLAVVVMASGLPTGSRLAAWALLANLAAIGELVGWRARSVLLRPDPGGSPP